MVAAVPLPDVDSAMRLVTDVTEQVVMEDLQLDGENEVLEGEQCEFCPVVFKDAADKIRHLMDHFEEM